jgi:hypothetical protein
MRRRSFIAELFDFILSNKGAWSQRGTTENLGLIRVSAANLSQADNCQLNTENSAS